MPRQPASSQIFVVSAPSGVGKTTLINKISPNWPNLCFSVSATTRPPRAGEVHGKDYLFFSREEFIRGVREDRFLEWAHVHGEYYGTDSRQIEGWLTEGKDVLLDIDVQGARQIRCMLPWARTIFILPPSMDVLQERLRKRATETIEVLTKRLAAAQREIQEAIWYDFIIVNDDLQEAAADFNAILRACHCDRAAQTSKLKPFLLPSLQPVID
ncbi:MAG: guanylate kinase [Desulforhabdus sp.]|nr:guanylate kinase [Desulforhabdus sp.]